MVTMTPAATMMPSFYFNASEFSLCLTVLFALLHLPVWLFSVLWGAFLLVVQCCFEKFQ
jgi:hypothetical protein